MARNIIEARRNVIGVTLFVRHEDGTIGRLAQDQLRDILSRYLPSCNDDGIRRLINKIGNALYPGTRHWKDDGSEDNAQIVKNGEQWKARKDDKDIWTLDVQGGVTLTVGRNLDRSFHDRGITVGITFANAQEATDFKRQVRDNTGHSSGVGSYVKIASTTYEQAFLVRSAMREHYTFTQGSRERLEGRVTRESDGSFRIAPLEGETLVVYGGNSLSLGWGPEYVQHPENGVFASVGPFSLRLVRSDTAYFAGMENFRIVAFEDQLLPIAPQERNSYNSDDYDDGRSPFGYYDEY